MIPLITETDFGRTPFRLVRHRADAVLTFVLGAFIRAAGGSLFVFYFSLSLSLALFFTKGNSWVRGLYFAALESVSLVSKVHSSANVLLSHIISLDHRHQLAPDCRLCYIYFQGL